MVKIRVYELAKELNVDSKKVINILAEKGIDVKNHMAILEDNHVLIARSIIGGGDGSAPGMFVPKIKRIPKAVIEAEAAKDELEADTKKAGLKAETEIKEAAKAVQAADIAVEIKESIKEQAKEQIKDKAGAETKEVLKTNTVPVKKASQNTTVAKDEKLEQVVSKPVQTSKNPVSKQDAPKNQGTANAERRDNRTGGYNQNRSQNTNNRTGGYNQNRPQGGDNRTGGYNQNRSQGGDNRTGGYNQNRPQGGDNRTGGYNQNRPQNADTRQDKRSFTKDKPQDGRFVGKDHNRAGAASKENVVPTTEMRYTTTPLAKPVSRRVDNVNKKRAGFDNPKDKRQNEKVKSGKFDNNYNKYNRYNKNRKKQFKKQVSMPPVIPKKVVIGETIILQELAKSMSKTAAELIKKLFDMGTMATINQELDSDTAILLADEFGVAVEVRQDKAIEIMEDEEDDIKEMKERPPVVTVMGHVDHGKTSLLDAIRKTSVTSTEAGGITQHIGAYQVESNGKKITFLDTPGHEAFTSMRARGAQVTDISILVVAADDGVMPQTIEAINHSKAAGVSIIVAINKIDKPAANPDKVKQELTEHGLIAEEWGGETIMVPVSAKTGEGLKNLMDMILLVAEVGELKANSKRAARGTVVEAELDKGRGPVATLLIQKGTLRVGDNILAGTVFGKVRAMFDDKNRKVKSAGPSMPVVILGFSEVPPPGEIFMVVKDERDARYVANMQQNKKKEEANNKFTRVSLDDLFKQISEGEVKELNIIIKADVQGSVEAVRQSFDKLSTDEVKVNIIHAGVGAIKESDIMLATASNAIIIGFNVRPDAQTRKAAEIAGVDVRLYRVIYDAIEDIKKAMAGLLDPDFKEVVQGHAEVRQIIKVPKIGLIAGSYVIDGKITRQSEVRIVRDGIVVFEGKILSLRRFKDDAKEVLSGFECGIGIEDFNDIKEGDVLEAFIMEETKREL